MGTVTPIKNKYAWLKGIPDSQIACRVGHEWPKIKPGKKLPKGVRVIPQHDGCCRIVETCGGCGKKRWKTTLPDRSYDINARYQYEDPEDWKKIPKSTGITRSDIAADNHRRCFDSWIHFVNESGSVSK